MPMVQRGVPDPIYFCYVDEVGDTGPLDPEKKDTQPIFGLAGVIIRSDSVPDLTAKFEGLKKRHHPSKLTSSHRLNFIKDEVKGSDLKKQVGKKYTHKRYRAYKSFYIDLLNCLVANNCKLIGRFWAKQVSADVNSEAIYTKSVQDLCTSFQHFLAERNAAGMVVCDSRTKALNVSVSHSIFTMKRRNAGDAFPNLVELPVFGHSDNHAGLQIADLIASGMLSAMAAHVCFGERAVPLRSVHVQGAFRRIRADFGQRLSRMQYRYESQIRMPGGRLMKHGGVHLTARGADVENLNVFAPPDEPASQQSVAKLASKFNATI